MVYIKPKGKIVSEFLEVLYPHNMIVQEEYANKAHLFIKQDVGCCVNYTNYGGADVVMFLSAMYPIINGLLNEAKESTCYRWVGNINIAKEKKISLSDANLTKGMVQAFPL